jgi:NAD(P)H-dependent FMN reductase
MPHTLDLAIIIGSTRKGRRAPTIANWFAREARQRDDMSIDLIDLADAHLPEVLGEALTPETAAVGERLHAADAFVIVTPEYNHSFPAPLKNAIDWHSIQWKAKPIGFVSYGGRSGGVRAVEQLRQVFVEMHAMTVRDSVSFHEVWNLFNPEGQPTNSTSCEKAAKIMLDQLAWWGNALKEARTKLAYGF